MRFTAFLDKRYHQKIILSGTSDLSTQWAVYQCLSITECADSHCWSTYFFQSCNHVYAYGWICIAIIFFMLLTYKCALDVCDIAAMSMYLPLFCLPWFTVDAIQCIQLLQSNSKSLQHHLWLIPSDCLPLRVPGHSNWHCLEELDPQLSHFTNLGNPG